MLSRGRVTRIRLEPCLTSKPSIDGGIDGELYTERMTRGDIRAVVVSGGTPLARQLLRLANDADAISRRAKRLAEKVTDAERDARALDAYLVNV